MPFFPGASLFKMKIERPARCHKRRFPYLGISLEQLKPNLYFHLDISCALMRFFLHTLTEIIPLFFWLTADRKTSPVHADCVVIMFSFLFSFFLNFEANAFYKKLKASKRSI